jgi:hypothetical protein
MLAVRCGDVQFHWRLELPPLSARVVLPVGRPRRLPVWDVRLVDWRAVSVVVHELPRGLLQPVNRRVQLCRLRRVRCGLLLELWVLCVRSVSSRLLEPDRRGGVQRGVHALLSWLVRCLLGTGGVRAVSRRHVEQHARTDGEHQLRGLPSGYLQQRYRIDVELAMRAVSTRVLRECCRRVLELAV